MVHMDVATPGRAPRVTGDVRGRRAIAAYGILHADRAAEDANVRPVDHACDEHQRIVVDLAEVFRGRRAIRPRYEHDCYTSRKWLLV